MTTIDALIRACGETSIPAMASLGLGATVLLGLAWLLARLLRGASAAGRYCIWQFALTGLLVLPLLYACLPGAPLGWSFGSPVGLTKRTDVTTNRARLTYGAASFGRALAKRDDDPATIPARVAETGAARDDRKDFFPGATGEVDVTASNGVHELSAKSQEEQTSLASTVPTGARWPTLVCGVWLLGVLFHLGWLARCARRARMLLPGADRLSGNRFEQVLNELTHRLPVSRTVELLKAPRVRVPVALGVLRPRILLPADCVHWSTERVRIVLAHELAHVQRRDVLWQLVARTAAALYWFHPLVWLAVRQMRNERERACDDRVLLAGVRPADYAAGLVEVAAALGGRRIRLLGGIGMAQRGQLEGRLRSILDSSLLRLPASRRVRNGLLLGTACLVTTLGLLRPFSPIRSAGSERGDTPRTPRAERASSRATEAPTTAAARQAAKRTMLIHVLRPDGRPVEGAKVHASVWTKEPFKANRDYVSDANGEAVVELPRTLRILRIWARLDGHVPLFAQWWPEEQPDGHLIPEAFTFRLPKGTVMGGIVKNEDGEPIQGVTVEVRRDSGGTELGRTRPRLGTWLAEGDDDPHGALTTDAQGRWTLNNVPAGDDVEVRVKLSHPDYVDDQVWGGLQDEQNVTTKALRARTAVIVMRRGISVSGTVTDFEGKPVSGAVVVWGDDPYWQTGSQEVRTNQQGHYRLAPLPPGPLSVTVIAEGWMPQLRKVDVHPGMEPEDFRLKPGMKLRIRFLDNAGAPVPNVYVMIDGWRGGRSLYNQKHPNVLDTKVPRTTDDNGIYEWTWAPDDEVTYSIGKEGYADKLVRITADGREHIEALPGRLRVEGSVEDARTGQAVRAFEVVPVIYFRPDFLVVNRREAVSGGEGRYAIEFDRSDIEHGVRFEAEGYRTQVAGPWKIGEPNVWLNVELEPAAPVQGIVVDADGRPVAGAEVYLATHTQDLDIPDQAEYAFMHKSNADGRFTFPAQFEPYALIVTETAGYADVSCDPEEQPGTLRLQPWARVEGRLLQAGKPVAGERLKLDPLRPRFYPLPRIEQTLWVKTDEQGRFVFERVPPVKCTVGAYLSVWRESALSSSESVPLEVQPGEHLTINLGGEGAQVSGHVVPSGETARPIDLNYSLNYLLHMAPGIEPPEAVAEKGFDWRRGWSFAWGSLEGGAYRDTLHHYFVKLDRDGRFRISGVPAGEYELALKLYEPPEDGCLVSPAGAKIVRFRVSEADVQKGKLDLGEVAVEVHLGPKPGESVPDFAFETADGATRKLSDLRGRYVLVDFWATWCAPCIASLPAMQQLHRKYEADDRLVVLGLNLDADKSQAQQFVKQRAAAWMQGFLGEWSKTSVPTHLGVGSIPAYLLIDPEGKLVQKGYATGEAIDKVGDVLK